MRRFTFLVATERSGSNFITSLLNGHPEVCGPPPTHLFRLFGTNRANYGDLEREANWSTLIEDFALAFSTKLGEWSTTITAEELAAGAEKRSVAELLRLAYEKEAEHDGATHLFVKENHTYRFAPFLLAHFPGCRFVYLVRDPRDVASSWLETESIPGGTRKAMEIWVNDQNESLSLHHQLRESGRMLLCRYEDLIARSESELRRVASFLGVPYEPAMLEFYREGRTVANAERIEAWANLGRPILAGNYGKYREVLPPDDLRYVEAVCGELMDFFGYPRELSADAVHLGEAELAALENSLSPGSYVVSGSREREIRRQRLAAIDRVLERRL